MSSSFSDPKRLGLRAFAAEAATVQGEFDLGALPRLQDSVVAAAESRAAPLVRWQASGRLRPVMGGEPEVWLSLQAHAELGLQCQRCLQTLFEAVRVDREFHFVDDEALAEKLDEEQEVDVLVLTREFDLQALIEDELILALPLVPRHDVCPQPLPQSGAQADSPAEARPKPFAALAALRKPPAVD